MPEPGLLSVSPVASSVKEMSSECWGHMHSDREHEQQLLSCSRQPRLCEVALLPAAFWNGCALIAFFALSSCPKSALTVVSEGLLLAVVVRGRDMTLQGCFCCRLMLCSRGVQGFMVLLSLFWVMVKAG